MSEMCDICGERPATKEILGAVLCEACFADPAPRAAGRKYDGGKLRYALLPPRPLREVVAVLTFGARKYDDDNWMRVFGAFGPRGRYADAAMRHVEAWRMGERYDEETGLHHLAHAACCMLFLIWFDLEENDKT